MLESTRIDQVLRGALAVIRFALPQEPEFQMAAAGSTGPPPTTWRSPASF